MKPPISGNLLLIGVLLLYLAIVIIIVTLQQRRRTTRWPFKPADKLLRGPGEELKRRIAAGDVRLIYELMSEWIKGETGERVFVAPLLALPGWWLELKPAKEGRLCRVVNPKWLPGHFARERPVLTPAQADLIALRLEHRCRDVED